MKKHIDKKLITYVAIALLVGFAAGIGSSSLGEVFQGRMLPLPPKTTTHLLGVSCADVENAMVRGNFSSTYSQQMKTRGFGAFAQTCMNAKKQECLKMNDYYCANGSDAFSSWLKTQPTSVEASHKSCLALWGPSNEGFYTRCNIE